MNIHMIGVGGIGMSAIAQLLLERGERVTGCDVKMNPITEKLREKGVVIYEGHSPEHIDNSIDLVVHSSAIKEGNPELVKAKIHSIPILRRAQMLGGLVKDKQLIAVTGTHGKTTTSFMIAHIMDYAGLEPGFSIGGEMNQLGGNAHWGSSNYFVVEADESDGTHVYLKPYIAVITNIDCDHMEYYSDISHISRTMQEFIDKVPQDGLVIGFGEDLEISKLLKNSKASTLTYGWDMQNDIYVTDLELRAMCSRFNVWYKGTMFGPVNLNIPGRHNVLNALASMGACVQIGIPFNNIIPALSLYPGVKRRLDVVFQNDGITIMDDYAHHPTEIRAVIDTVRKMAKGRLIGVFQPHRFTRTKFLVSQFRDCFTGLDKLILTDIYGAGESPIEGITGKVIYDEVIGNGNPDTVYIESKDDILDYLVPQLQRGDTVVFMGAGDITEIAHKIGPLIVEHSRVCV